ncbi:MAG: hypothetical protein QM642_07710 [Edaphocola sp.]
MTKIVLPMIAGVLMVLATSGSHAQTFKEKYFRESSYIFDDLQKIRQPELFTIYNCNAI